jgi:DNA (cytosine-5)-methyltransferase 1
LFTGAGALDVGLEAAGFRVGICIEVDEDARRTLKLNRPAWKLAEPGDIHKIQPEELLLQAGLSRGDVALLAAGPPCQPFSKSAYWANGRTRGLRDPRATTLHAYLRVVEAALPSVILLENVKGIASNSHKGEGGLKFLQEGLGTINRRQRTEYDIQLIHLNAADYGVPQIRERLFIVASIDGRKLTMPPPTHGDRDGLEPYRTAWDAIGDLDEETRRADLEPTGKWASLLNSIPEGKNYLWHTPRGEGQSLFGWRTRYWSFLLKLSKRHARALRLFFLDSLH